MSGAGNNRLPSLAGEVGKLHREIGVHAQKMADKALEVGAKLVEAKELVPHGGWSDWLAEAGINDRTARRYMLLHRSGLKSATVADLGLREAGRVAGLLVNSATLEKFRALPRHDQETVVIHLRALRRQIEAERAELERETESYREALAILHSDDPERGLAQLKRQITTTQGRVKEIATNTKRLEYRSRKLAEERDALLASLADSAAR